MTTIVVTGAIANKYLNGGEAWIRLSWIRGLQRLGCRVYFIEQIDPAACVGDGGGPAPFERSATRVYFDRVMEEFDLVGSSALVVGEGEATSGLTYEEVLDLA